MYFITQSDEDKDLHYVAHTNSSRVNPVTIGSIYKEVDGYYVFVFVSNTRHGFFEAGFFRFLADKLDEMNKEWNDIVQNDPKIGG